MNESINQSINRSTCQAKFKEQGALYERADDWNSKAVTAGKLVTGQNPQSSGAVADAVLEALQA